MSLLNNDLAAKVYKAFKGKLLTGLIRQESFPSSGGNDAKGDPIDVAATFREMQGFTEDYDDAYRAASGIPETDLKVNIFAESIPGIQVGKDDKAMFRGRFGDAWYQIRRAKIDPASALWICQSFAIPAPDDAP